MALVFTQRADMWLARVMLGLVLSAVLALAGLYYYGPPEYTRVGYAPAQPVAFSHEQHSGRLGLSCLYCHTGAEESPHARIPSTQTCMNCHQTAKKDSPKLAPIRDSFASGRPMRWIRVHKLPDYAYFTYGFRVCAPVAN